MFVRHYGQKIWNSHNNSFISVFNKFYEIIGLTVTHMFRNNAKKFPDNDYLGWCVYDKETKKNV
jgi:hypothetical protein